MSSVELRKFLDIMEARQPSDDTEYTDDKDTVTLNVSGSKSGKITKLAKQYMEVRRLEAELKKQKDSMTADLKSVASDLFDAEDDLKTKYIKTVSTTMTITKDISPSKKEEFDESGFFSEVRDLIDEEIVSKLLEIRDKYIQIKTIAGRKGSLRDVKMKESFINESFLTNLKNYIHSFAKKITSRIPLFDKKFDNIKNKYNL